MPSPLNVASFERFINNNGQVTFAQASQYADIGDEIIRLAMENPSTEAFESAMETLQKKHANIITDGKHSVSNMASCLLYAQTRANFNLHQGYGKGSNINQYGDAETSHQTIANLMIYFSKVRQDKEYGYDAPSTHGKWRDPSKKLPDNIPDLKLRIDIDPDPTTGSIPAPLKGVHTAHLVPGVDKSGIPKLLIKPENWGMNKMLHKIMHALDFMVTRFQAQNLKGLEGRQETKLTKETSVVEAYTDLKVGLNHDIDQVTDRSLKHLLKDINNNLDAMKKNKGFDKPMAALEAIKGKLDHWIQANPSHENRVMMTALRNTVENKMHNMARRKDEKYGSENQTNSEVRLIYQADRTISVEKKSLEAFKIAVQAPAVEGPPSDPTQEGPPPPTPFQ